MKRNDCYLLLAICHAEVHLEFEFQREQGRAKGKKPMAKYYWQCTGSNGKSNFKLYREWQMAKSQWLTSCRVKYLQRFHLVVFSKNNNGSSRGTAVGEFRMIDVVSFHETDIAAAYHLGNN